MINTISLLARSEPPTRRPLLKSRRAIGNMDGVIGTRSGDPRYDRTIVPARARLENHSFPGRKPNHGPRRA
jgi:hypothetical protein